MPLDVQYDMSVRVTRKSGQIKAINVPPEEFLVSRHAVSLDDAHFRRAPHIDDCVRACCDGLRPRSSSSSTQARASSTPTAR